MVIRANFVKNTREKTVYIYNEAKAGLIHSNMGFKDMQRVIQLFKSHNKLHATPLKAMHIIVAFPPEDILTNEKIKEIARELLNRLEMKNCPWVLVEHIGKNPHFHLLVHRINWQARLTNRDWNVVRALMPIARSLERDFNLIPNDANRKRGDYRTSDEIFGFRKKFTYNEYVRIHVSSALEKSYDMLDFKMYCEEKGIRYINRTHGDMGERDGLVYNFKKHYVPASSLGDKYMLDAVEKYVEDRPKRVSKMLLGIVDEELHIDKVRNSHWRELSFKMRERGIKMELDRFEGKNELKLNFENKDYYPRINQEIMRLLIEMFRKFQQENSYANYEREETPSYLNSIKFRNESYNQNNDNSASKSQDSSKKKGWRM